MAVSSFGCKAFDLIRQTDLNCFGDVSLSLCLPLSYFFFLPENVKYFFNGNCFLKKAPFHFQALIVNKKIHVISAVIKRTVRWCVSSYLHWFSRFFHTNMFLTQIIYLVPTIFHSKFHSFTLRFPEIILKTCWISGYETPPLVDICSTIFLPIRLKAISKLFPH